MTTFDTIKQWLRHAYEELAEHTETPWPDAEILMAYVLGKTRTYLYAWPEHPLEAEQADQYRQLIARRKNGEPVAYLTGVREFWSREFQVTSDVLIPRPETELLVELALERIKAALVTPLRGGTSAAPANTDNPPARRCAVADLGTGSGAIAITLALECPRIDVVAGDVSAQALRIAKSNAERLGAGHVRFYLSSWLDDLPPQRFDVIVSNPPYIAERDPCLNQGDLRFEPPGALASGSDGLRAIRHIAATARSWLHPGGWLLLEHGYDQAPAVQSILLEQGYASPTTHQDLAGLDRVTMGRLPATD